MECLSFVLNAQRESELKGYSRSAKNTHMYRVLKDLCATCSFQIKQAPDCGDCSK